MRETGVARWLTPHDIPKPSNTFIELGKGALPDGIAVMRYRTSKDLPIARYGKEQRIHGEIVADSTSRLLYRSLRVDAYRRRITESDDSERIFFGYFIELQMKDGSVVLVEGRSAAIEPNQPCRQRISVYYSKPDGQSARAEYTVNVTDAAYTLSEQSLSEVTGAWEAPALDEVQKQLLYAEGLAAYWLDYGKKLTEAPEASTMGKPVEAA